MVAAQGGDPSFVERPERLPRAPVVLECRADRAGVVEGVAPRALGWTVVELGGGRRALGDRVDPAVGFLLRVAPGDRVSAEDPIGEVHAADEPAAARARAALLEAVVIGEGPARVRPLVSHRVTPGGVERP
jgi:thymidine phosphorylase